jgi:hypothetical protein
LLQKFFDELQRDKMLRSVSFFIAFLSMADNKAFEKKKKDLVKVPSPKDPQDIGHLGGQTSVGVTAEKVLAQRGISSWVPSCQGLYDKLIKANEETVKIMRALVESYNKQSEIYKELALSHASIEVIDNQIYS